MQENKRENFSESEENFPAEEELKQEDKENDEEKQKKNSISADLIRGHINTIILRSLYEGDRYGYDIINEIEQKSHGQYTLKQPTLYSALKRLESQGYVKSYWGGVSNGGRRRYFSLTEEGKKVTEKNQAEWEYSRTIIDSLISENDFDFSNPAPEKLDFRILRQATSRTPIVGETQAESYSTAIFNPSETNERDLIKDLSELKEPEPDPITGQPPIIPTEPALQESTPIIQPQINEILPPKQTIQTEPPVIPMQPPFSAPAEETAKEQEEPSIPLFITRTEEERNYKDILARIYRNGIKQEQHTEVKTESMQTIEVSTETAESTIDTSPIFEETVPKDTPPSSSSEELTVKYNETKRPLASGRIDFQDIEEQARYDGLRVWTAGGASVKKEFSENFFNKGWTLFRSGLIFFAVAILETLFVFLFKDTWNIGLNYIILMLVFACVPTVICTVLFLLKYQPCCKRLKNNTSVYNGVIAFISAFILLVAADLLMDISFNDGVAVIKYIVIPLVYLLNIIVFSATYYLFSRSKE